MKNASIFPLERNRYFYGKLLTVRDFELEQTYLNNKRRLINKAVLGAGVVCGLGVTQADDYTLIVESGMALDYLGREIVVDSPVVRKLQMLEGFEALGGASQCYLCLKYDEKDAEPVGAIASESQETQFNKTEEGYRLYLDVEEPDVPRLLTAAGQENVCLLYQSSEVTIAFAMPQAVLADEDFTAQLMVLKSSVRTPLSFDLDLPSEFIAGTDGDPHIRYSFRENPMEQKHIRSLELTLHAANLSGTVAELAPNGGLITVNYGDTHEQTALQLPAKARICGGMEDLRAYQSVKDNLRTRLQADDLPMYLAKIQLLPAGASTMIGSVYSLPFDQRLRHESAASGGAGLAPMAVTSEVEVLKSWQQPEAQARYNHATQSLHFKFGIPQAQEYDYANASGVVEIPMSSGLRVNARYISEEIPHNLGIGNVDIRLAVEFEQDGEKAQYFGNREVFKPRATAAPLVQTAAILYPERGTFRVGVWLLDNVEGSVIRVRYYASKVSRDLSAVRREEAVSVRIVPEVQRVHVRDRLHLKAAVYGCEDRSVIWSVKDENGGAIDQNGLYQAPDQRGTYEVVAASRYNPEVKVSAFVIVEE